jgi:hypothetical protein
MASFQYYDPKYLCLCGMHVEVVYIIINLFVDLIYNIIFYAL